MLAIRPSRRPARITNGKYAGPTGAIENNMYQRTADYLDWFVNGYHVMPDKEELVTLRVDQVEQILWAVGLRTATGCKSGAYGICGRFTKFVRIPERYLHLCALPTHYYFLQSLNH